MLQEKDFGEAIEHLSKVIKSGREASASLYANYYLGLIYFEREMYNDAINFFGRALEIGPNLYEAKYYLALSYYKRGNVSKAMGTWNEMVEKNPHNRWSQLAKRQLSGENQNNE